MSHILTEKETKVFMDRLGVLYEEWKNNHAWDGDRNSYKAGIIDFCDALIFASSKITYDISNLRNDTEEHLDDIDFQEERRSS